MVLWISAEVGWGSEECPLVAGPRDLSIHTQKRFSCFNRHVSVGNVIITSYEGKSRHSPLANARYTFLIKTKTKISWLILSPHKDTAVI